MGRFTKVFAESGFASGAKFYSDSYPGLTEIVARLVIDVLIDDTPVPAIVDTGAPWCVFAPNVIEPLIATGQAEYTGSADYVVRGHRYSGEFFRLDIVVQDEARDFIVIDATVFVPTLHPGEMWTHPNFLGLSGFLDRICFAVDPVESMFYFGPA